MTKTIVSKHDKLAAWLAEKQASALALEDALPLLQELATSEPGGVLSFVYDPQTQIARLSGDAAGLAYLRDLIDDLLAPAAPSGHHHHLAAPHTLQLANAELVIERQDVFPDENHPTD